MIIGIIAGSITIIGFFISIYRQFKKNYKIISERIDNIELSLNSKQKFKLLQGTKVNIENSNRILILDRDEEFILDNIKDNIVFGKIYSNTVNIKITISDLDEEI